jgi:hypothetical protein
MWFKDISHFQNVHDYLPILNACISADLLVIYLVYDGPFGSTFLKKWYESFHLSAAIADILILFIGLIITRFLYRFLFNKFNIILFTGLAVIVQIIHDFLFYQFFTSLPRKYNYMLDLFKYYSKEVGIKAILGDSFMIVITCVLASLFASMSLNTNIIILASSVYLLPYFVYFRK